MPHFAAYRYGRNSLFTPLVALLLLLASAGAGASPSLPTAPAVSDGNYTVTPAGCRDSYSSLYCVSQWLEERVEPNGSFQVTSGIYTNKPEGSYSYRTGDLYCDTYYSTCLTQYSEAVTVVVSLNAPELDPLESQLRYRYQTRAGNVVGGSGIDILVERVAGGEAGNGVIDTLILRQESNKTFTPVVPTATQASSSAWAPADLSIELEDIDVDGFVDVTVGNIDSIVPGTLDQIVYSPGRLLSSSPKAVRAVDSALTEFTANVLDYVIDSEYYIDNAPLTAYVITYETWYCASYSGYETYDAYGSIGSYCFWYPTWTYLAAPDYSAFSPEAIEIWEHEDAIESGTLTRSQGVDKIKSAVERVLGVAIGGWDMGGIFGDPRSSEDIDARKGLEAFLAVLGIANANAQEVDTDQAPRQVERKADLIYIVGRYVFGEGTNRLHTALYYQIPGIGVQSWLSAFDSDKRALFDGILVAETNDARDVPTLMRFTLGTVTPPSPETPYGYFFSKLVPAHSHYRALPENQRAPYDAIPELPPCPWCKGRNSNGYVNGLITATNGQPSIERRSVYYDLSKLVGWEYPVEASYFGL